MSRAQAIETPNSQAETSSLAAVEAAAKRIVSDPVYLLTVNGGPSLSLPKRFEHPPFVRWMNWFFRSTGESE